VRAELVDQIGAERDQLAVAEIDDVEDAEDEREAERHDRDQRVDEKHPLPVGERDDHAADDRTEAQSDAEDDSPGAKRLAPFASFLKLMRQHGDLADQHRAAAHALKKPADDQHRRAPRKPADQRSDRE